MKVPPVPRCAPERDVWRANVSRGSARRAWQHCDMRGRSQGSGGGGDTNKVGGAHRSYGSHTARCEGAWVQVSGNLLTGPGPQPPLRSPLRKDT